jgi:hypothetical protein
MIPTVPCNNSHTITDLKIWPTPDSTEPRARNQRQKLCQNRSLGARTCGIWTRSWRRARRRTKRQQKSAMNNENRIGKRKIGTRMSGGENRRPPRTKQLRSSRPGALGRDTSGVLAARLGLRSENHSDRKNRRAGELNTGKNHALGEWKTRSK